MKTKYAVEAKDLRDARYWAIGFAVVALCFAIGRAWDVIAGDGDLWDVVVFAALWSGVIGAGSCAVRFTKILRWGR